MLVGECAGKMLFPIGHVRESWIFDRIDQIRKAFRYRLDNADQLAEQQISAIRGAVEDIRIIYMLPENLHSDVELVVPIQVCVISARRRDFV